MTATYRWGMSFLGIAAVGFIALPADAQSLSDRIDQVKQQRAAEQRRAVAHEPASLRERMRDIVDRVEIEDATLEQAFRWWSDTTQIPLVVDWNQMENEGIARDQRVNLRLNNIPAGQLLALLMAQAGPDAQLMYETTPWYIQVTTLRQANKRLVLRVYLVNDLVMDIPNFEGPSFDLNDALSNTNAGGSNASSGGGSQGKEIFRQEQPAERAPTKQERGDALAQTVRDTVEPTLWNEVEGARVAYFDGKLIVNAPLYVHQKIGLVAVSETGAASPSTSTRYRSTSRMGVGDLDPVAGVNTPTPIASVQR